MYTEPDGSAIIGSFVHHSVNVPSNHWKSESNQTPKESSASFRKTQETKIKDIRTFFIVSSTTQPNRKAIAKEPEAIEID